MLLLHSSPTFLNLVHVAKKNKLKFGVLYYQVLIKMLPSYYKHICRYENSLVTKFFGVHCVKPVGGVKVCDKCQISRILGSGSFQ